MPVSRHHRGALLSPAEATILSAIITNGPLRQRELVAMTSHNATTVSIAVKHLRAGGWVSGKGQAPVEVAPGAVVRAMAAALQPVGRPWDRPSRCALARVSPVGRPYEDGSEPVGQQ